MDPRATCLLCTEVEVAQNEAPVAELPGAPGGDEVRLLDLGHNHVRVLSRTEPSAWPKQTACRCWWCTFPFEGPPLPMPTNYSRRADLFTVTGIFCSWECMKAYNANERGYLSVRCTDLISLLRKRATGVLAPIKRAPPRWALSVYGGTMSIQEFRGARHTDVQYHLLPDNMIVKLPVMATSSTQPRKRLPRREDRAVDFTDVQQFNEPLRLKRPKPLGQGKGAMEKTMGFNLFARQPEAAAS